MRRFLHSSDTTSRRRSRATGSSSRQIPRERIVYSHIAGHLQVGEDVLVDTHGEAIIDPVWALLAEAYKQFGAFPTLLERDTNIPPLAELMQEVNKIAAYQAKSTIHKSSKHA